MRKLAGVLMLCCASMALAQGVTGDGARGIGVAENADGKKVRFAFETAKVTYNDRTFIGGRLELSEVVRNARLTTNIVLPAVQRLVVTGHTAEFAGPGVLNVVDNHSVHRFLGTVVANVADLGVPTDNTDPEDTIRVRFIPREVTGTSYEFAGSVKQGDILVRAQ